MIYQGKIYRYMPIQNSCRLLAPLWTVQNIWEHISSWSSCITGSPAPLRPSPTWALRVCECARACVCEAKARLSISYYLSRREGMALSSIRRQTTETGHTSVHWSPKKLACIDELHRHTWHWSIDLARASTVTYEGRPAARVCAQPHAFTGLTFSACIALACSLKKNHTR